METDVQLNPPLMSPAEFKAFYTARGWSGRLLAIRWRKTAVWLSKVVNNPDRDPHWDDAVRALPKYVEPKKPKAKAKAK